jgi:uncharacterized protein (DUF111 family)
MGRREDLVSILIQNSSTLGVRWYPVERDTAWRRIETAETRWGPIRIKLRGWQGRVIDAVPEFDDCAAIAREHDVAVRDVWNEAHRYGEVFIGRRYADGGLTLLDSGGRASGSTADQ